MAAKEIKELRLSVRTKDSHELLNTFCALYISHEVQNKELCRVWDLKKVKNAATVHYVQQEEAIRNACWATSTQMFLVLTPIITRLLRHKDWEFQHHGDKKREQHKRAPNGSRLIFYAPTWQQGVLHGTIEVLIYENRHHSDPLTLLILEW